MASFIFLVTFAGLEPVWGSCNKYKCSNSINQCITTSNGVTKLDDTFCTGGQYCKPYYDNSYDMYGYCVTYVYTDRYPGALCTYDSQCYSNLCVDSACKGTESGESCSIHKDCDVGLYCNSNYVCAELKEAGETCSSEWDCNKFHGCNNGICTKYFSIYAGSTTEVECSGYYSSFCESGNCADKDGAYVCIKAFTYDKGGEIVKCSSSLDCGATSGSYTVNYKCYCGLNIYGYAYCALLAGSSYWDDYKSFMNNWASSSTAKKSHRREGVGQNLLDYGSNSQLRDFAKYFLYSPYADSYYNADYCVTEIFFNLFRDYYDSEDITDSLLYLEIPAGLFLLVIS